MNNDKLLALYCSVIKTVVTLTLVTAVGYYVSHLGSPVLTEVPVSAMRVQELKDFTIDAAGLTFDSDWELREFMGSVSLPLYCKVEVWDGGDKVIGKDEFNTTKITHQVGTQLKLTYTNSETSETVSARFSLDKSGSLAYARLDEIEATGSPALSNLTNTNPEQLSDYFREDCVKDGDSYCICAANFDKLSVKFDGDGDTLSYLRFTKGGAGGAEI